jgi:hypothetical protein
VVAGTTAVANLSPGEASPHERRQLEYAAPARIAATPWIQISSRCPNVDSPPAWTTTADQVMTRSSGPGLRAIVRQARPRGDESTTTAAVSSKHQAVAPASRPTAVPSSGQSIHGFQCTSSISTTTRPAARVTRVHGTALAT